MFMGIDDKKFEALLEERRHKDLLKALGTITKLLHVEDNMLSQAIDTQSQAIEVLITRLSKFLEQDNKSAADKELIVKTIKELKLEKPRGTSWEFDIIRDKEGLIKSVKAKQV